MQANLRHIGHRLQSQRLGLGMTVSELADRSSVAAHTISAIETGDIERNAASVVALALNLGINLFDLFLPPTEAQSGNIVSLGSNKVKR